MIYAILGESEEKPLTDYCTCKEPRPLPMYWLEGQDVVCKCMKVIPKEKLTELNEKLKKKPIKPAPPLIEPLPLDECVNIYDNRQKINEIIKRINE